MNRRSFMMAGAASALAPHFLSANGELAAADYRALGAIRDLGLAEDTSEVMKTASYMMDVLGPRLSGSPGIRKSGEWVVEKLKGWGLTGAALEPWPTDPTGTNNGFPRGWTNRRFYLHATTPNAFPISGMSIGWTPGTNGPVSGECVMVTETDEAELRRMIQSPRPRSVPAAPAASEQSLLGVVQGARPPRACRDTRGSQGS